jgi:hypothetical protein
MRALYQRPTAVSAVAGGRKKVRAGLHDLLQSDGKALALPGERHASFFHAYQYIITYVVTLAPV